MTTALQEAWLVLQDKQAFFDGITGKIKAIRLAPAQMLIIAACFFAYGLVMGSYNSLGQALLSGVKLWVLLFLTLLICFPSFYIVQMILGFRIPLLQLLVILLGGFVTTGAIVLAFAPIVLFFQLSGDNYRFLQLLHVAIFAFGGFFGMRVILEALKHSLDEAQVYPKLGLHVFRIWAIIFAFVGLQLSWNLRPFIGSKDMPFELFRKETQGNVYSTLLGNLGHLLNNDGGQTEDRKQNTEEEAAPEVQRRD